jgi:hypothetical protein
VETFSLRLLLTLLAKVTGTKNRQVVSGLKTWFHDIVMLLVLILNDDFCVILTKKVCEKLYTCIFD